MGTFTYPLRITVMDGERSVDIEATVDTGALYTMLPARTLRELGVERAGSRRFLIGDGRRIQMDIGYAWATIDGERAPTIVAFGEDNAPPVLGRYTLDGLGLAVDPASQQLVPATLMMLNV